METRCYTYKPSFFRQKSEFNKHAKFILTEQIRHINIDKEKNKERLKQRENFWILTLETLMPKGLNQKLINIVACIIFFTYFHLPNAC